MRQPVNPDMVPRQPSACGLCGFPDFLHDGLVHEYPILRGTGVVCARYRFPSQEQILARMRERAADTYWGRWTMGRSQDR